MTESYISLAPSAAAEAAATSRRIGWVDYAKSMTIFIVMLIHTQCNYELVTVLKAFTMPVFFFMSGLLFNAERNAEFKPFAVKRFRQLIVPYFWMSALSYVAWVTVLRYYGDDANSNVEWIEPLHGILLGIPPLMVHNIPLWSFLCFFTTEMVYYMATRFGHISDVVVGASALFIALVINQFAPDGGLVLPLSLAAMPLGLFFYAIGHWIRANAPMLLRFNPLLLLVGVAMLLGGGVFNCRIVFYNCFIGNPALFLLGATGGILAMVQFTSLLAQLIGHNLIIRRISNATLIICGFHLLMFALFKGVLLFFTPLPPTLLTDSLPMALLLCLATLLVCLPLAALLHRHARFLVNK